MHECIAREFLVSISIKGYNYSYFIAKIASVRKYIRT